MGHHYAIFHIQIFVSSFRASDDQLNSIYPSFPRTRESRLSTISLVESLDSHVRARLSGVGQHTQKAVIPNTRVAQRNE